ncbi:MAG: primosomal protein N' [Solirubrobacterales bacterium]|nr:primosomal protein N' [Solirubrobacterales bacterium]
MQPLTRTRSVRGLFDYKLDPGQLEVAVGDLVAIPFGRQRAKGVVVELASESELPRERLVTPTGLLGPAIPEELIALAQWMAREYCSTLARALTLVMAPGAAGGVRAKQVLVAELTEAGRLALHDGASLTQGQRSLLGALERRGTSTAAELGTQSLRRLERRGLVTISESETPRRPQRFTIGRARAERPELSEQQRLALAPVLEALREGSAQSFLLHGVTGSGKTEVYLRAVEQALELGRGAIVLVPEIALTPQALSRFEARFGEAIAVMHSGLTQGQRFDEWQRLRSGAARVCVGPRSAIFAPLSQLGLIVVDEEHEASYKHEGDPRYDARTIAARRAEQHGAVLLCGSATPRPESATALRRLRLPARIDGAPLPPVEILDMRGAHHPLHPETRMALADLRRSKGKAIVLLNRRGWSNFLSCRSCGRVWMCPNCEVALVLHRGQSVVACHHCGHHQPVPRRCPDCSSVALARHGAGTEQIELELREALGEGVEVLRLDADAAGLGLRAKTLARFESAHTAVLVGTQMVAKGHDFPDVTLGIVLDADGTLRFPDFRAEERAFALVTQLAGRAGRGEAGRVLVQTIAPEARAIKLASRHDADGFLVQELARRRALGYPPFSTLIRVVCSADRAEPAQSVAEAVLRAAASVPGTVLGPAPLFRLRGRSRMQLVFKCEQRSAGIASVGSAVDRVADVAARQRVSVSVDVDPQ